MDAVKVLLSLCLDGEGRNNKIQWVTLPPRATRQDVFGALWHALEFRGEAASLAGVRRVQLDGESPDEQFFCDVGVSLKTNEAYEVLLAPSPPAAAAIGAASSSPGEPNGGSACQDQRRTSLYDRLQTAVSGASHATANPAAGWHHVPTEARQSQHRTTMPEQLLLSRGATPFFSSGKRKPARSTSTSAGKRKKTPVSSQTRQTPRVSFLLVPHARPTNAPRVPNTVLELLW